MRIQFVPFPLMKPLHPSSLHIFARAFPTESLYSLRPRPWTWYRIFNLSRGDTTVLDTAPATPPAQKAAVNGVETNSCMRWSRSGGVGMGSFLNQQVTRSRRILLTTGIFSNSSMDVELSPSFSPTLAGVLSPSRILAVVVVRWLKQTSRFVRRC